jgi:hypothetical protein
MASPTRGSAPWTPAGVPPVSLALRGRKRRVVDAGTGTNKIGVWGRRAQHAKA